MRQVIRVLVHPDQTGLMPFGAARLNLHRLQNNMYRETQKTEQRVILSLDANKAFDSIEWRYMFAVLVKMGIGPNLIKWVRLLY